MGVTLVRDGYRDLDPIDGDHKIADLVEREIKMLNIPHTAVPRSSPATSMHNVRTGAIEPDMVHHAGDVEPLGRALLRGFEVGG